MPPKTTSELITTPQAASILAKSTRSVHRLVDSGDLTPQVKLPGPNGAYLFHRSDVEALAAKVAAE